MVNEAALRRSIHEREKAAMKAAGIEERPPPLPERSAAPSGSGLLGAVASLLSGVPGLGSSQSQYARSRRRREQVAIAKLEQEQRGERDANDQDEIPSLCCCCCVGPQPVEVSATHV